MASVVTRHVARVVRKCPDARAQRPSISWPFKDGLGGAGPAGSAGAGSSGSEEAQQAGVGADATTPTLRLLVRGDKQLAVQVGAGCA